MASAQPLQVFDPVAKTLQVIILFKKNVFRLNKFPSIKLYVPFCNKFEYIYRIYSHQLNQPIADPIKRFFFAHKEFFRFLLVNFHVCCIWKNFIDYKIT